MKTVLFSYCEAIYHFPTAIDIQLQFSVQIVHALRPGQQVVTISSDGRYSRIGEYLPDGLNTLHDGSIGLPLDLTSVRQVCQKPRVTLKSGNGDPPCQTITTRLALEKKNVKGTGDDYYHGRVIHQDS